jgi:hypothetical protein
LISSTDNSGDRPTGQRQERAVLLEATNGQHRDARRAGGDVGAGGEEHVHPAILSLAGHGDAVRLNERAYRVEVAVWA